MKRVLILVVSCENQPNNGIRYRDMCETSLRTWDSIEINGVETIFYFGFLDTPFSNEKVVSFPVEESLFTMGHKDLLAYEWALKNKSFDYVARVNSSCFVDKQKLFDYCQNIQENNLFQCVIAESCHGFLYGWGGGHYLMSRDVMQKIVDKKHLWNHKWIEDEAMSVVVKLLDVPFKNGYACALHKKDNGYICFYYGNGLGGGEEFKELSEMKNFPTLKDQFFFRVKNDGDRSVDEVLMNELYKNIINAP